MRIEEFQTVILKTKAVYNQLQLSASEEAAFQELSNNEIFFFDTLNIYQYMYLKAKVSHKYMGDKFI